MLAEINRKAWRVAAYAMMKKGKSWEICSTGKIREIYATVCRGGGDNFAPAIETIMNEYTPPEDKKQNELVFKAFGEALMKELQGMTRADAKQLLEYVLWDIRVLENLFKGWKENELRTNLKRRFSAEGEKGMNLMEEIMQYWKKEEGGGRKKKGGYAYKGAQKYKKVRW
jgi:hypothetical protein